MLLFCEVFKDILRFHPFTVSCTSVPCSSQLHHLYTEHTHLFYHCCFPYCVISWPLHKHLPFAAVLFSQKSVSCGLGHPRAIHYSPQSEKKKKKSILVSWQSFVKPPKSLLHPVPPTIRSEGGRPVRQRTREQLKPSALWISQDAGDLPGTRERERKKKL